ncbi:MAG: rod shape-determining protein MreC [Rhodospirillaceae bacterium]
MKETRRTVNRIAQPVKTLAQRFAFVALVLGAVALIVLGRVDVGSVERARNQILDAVAPILDALSQPVVTVNRWVTEGRELFAIRAQNEALREDRARLMHWQAAARRLEAENRVLRELLNYQAGPVVSFISGRVIADTGGAFVHSLVVNAGEAAGVQKGQAVVTSDGLLGRVASVGERAGRVLLITDLNSRIPVVIEQSRVRAIMAGNNTAKPRLIHLPTGGTVSIGERVVTSGHGGAFPPGLPIGVVSAVGEGGIEVTPFVNRDRVEYVRILDFGLDGIIHDLPNASGRPTRTRR